MMKTLALALMVCAVAGTALAQADTCASRATDKKLHGAALHSFMKKCKTDSEKTCDATAMDKKLAGAAKTSFTKKCVRDAVGG